MDRVACRPCRFGPRPGNEPVPGEKERLRRISENICENEEREGVEEGYLCISSCWLVWILVASERLSRGVRESNASLRERKASKRCERLVGVLCGLLS